MPIGAPIPDRAIVPRSTEAGRLALLSRSFRRDVDKFHKWSSQSNPFAPDSARNASRHGRCGCAGIRFHAAVSALIDTGMKPAAIRSLADLVTPVNFKRICGVVSRWSMARKIRSIRASP